MTAQLSDSLAVKLVKATQDEPEHAKLGGTKVKIYRREKAGYEVYEIADYSHGKRRLRSLSDHDEAVAEAKKICRLLAAGETTAAQIRNPDAASYGRAVQLLRPTGISLEIAAAHFADAFKILGGDLIVAAAADYARRHAVNREKKTVQAVVDEMLAFKTGRGASAAYLAGIRWRLAKIGKDFAVYIATVTTPDVQKWLDGMKGSPRSVLNFRRTVSTLFSFAESRGYIAKGENPATGTEKIATRTKAAVEIYSPDEITKLLTAAPESFRVILAVGAFAGLRSAEIWRLDWGQVDLKAGFIEVTADNAKTASRRLVPVSENLKAWLESSAPKKGKLWNLDASQFQRRTAAAVAVAGLKWKANGLRHSFISYRVAQAQDVAKVALEAGNSPAMIFSNYREVVKPDAAAKWFAITPDTIKPATEASK